MCIKNNKFNPIVHLFDKLDAAYQPDREMWPPTWKVMLIHLQVQWIGQDGGKIDFQIKSVKDPEAWTEGTKLKEVISLRPFFVENFWRIIQINNFWHISLLHCLERFFCSIIFFVIGFHYIIFHSDLEMYALTKSNIIKSYLKCTDCWNKIS